MSDWAMTRLSEEKAKVAALALRRTMKALAEAREQLTQAREAIAVMVEIATDDRGAAAIIRYGEQALATIWTVDVEDLELDL